MTASELPDKVLRALLDSQFPPSPFTPYPAPTLDKSICPEHTRHQPCRLFCLCLALSQETTQSIQTWSTIYSLRAQLSLSICGELVPGPSSDTKIYRCQIPSYLVLHICRFCNHGYRGPTVYSLFFL